MVRKRTGESGVRALEYSAFQSTTLVALRLLIGWHLLYEGLAKLLNPYWTAAGYLSESKWWFSDVFVSMASNPSWLTVVDFVNEWALVVIGAALMLGIFTRAAIVAGIVLLFLYWVAAPPFVGYAYSTPSEGSYLIVNKTLIEMAALSVLLAFPTGQLLGLDRLIFWRRRRGERDRELALAGETT